MGGTMDAVMASRWASFTLGVGIFCAALGRAAPGATVCAPLLQSYAEITLDLTTLRLMNQELNWLEENLPNYQTKLPVLDEYCQIGAQKPALQILEQRAQKLAGPRNKRVWKVPPPLPELSDRIQRECVVLLAQGRLSRWVLSSADLPADRLRKTGGALRAGLRSLQVTVADEIRAYYDLLDRFHKLGCRIPD